MNELVIARKCQLDRNAERLDRHDRYRSNSGANRDVDQRILLAVDRGNPINHQRGEDRDRQTINKETCEEKSAIRVPQASLESKSYLAEQHIQESH